MKPLNALVIDNFDSFSFNLVDELEKRGAKVEVWRNDIEAEFALEQVLAMAPPRLIVISPGPGTPSEAGCSVELIRLACGKVPVFGVCLGHQSIVEAFGGQVGYAGEVVHGKTAHVTHDQSGIFAQLACPLVAARYHSLAATKLPEVLRVSATTGDLVMAVEHRSAPIIGVQFHPESIITPAGGQLMAAVMRWAGQFQNASDTP